MYGKAAAPSAAAPERKKAVSVGAGANGAQPAEDEMKEALGGQVEHAVRL